MAETIAWKDLPGFLESRLGDLGAKTQDMFMVLGTFVDREVQVTFARIAATGTSDQIAANRTVWKGYSLKTLHPVYEVEYQAYNPHLDKWNKRYGTDGSRGKYSESSKLNQKSGTFRKSFRMMQLTSRSMRYGTDWPSPRIAAHLLENRPAINYDDTMAEQFKTLCLKWLGENLFKAK